MDIINWLLAGDAAIQYQTHRDLLMSDYSVLEPLQARIAHEGWGKTLLSLQKPDGHWGEGYYQHKWTCTHYTLQELMNLSINKDTKQITGIVNKVLIEEKGADGGVNPASGCVVSDVCVTGMALAFCSYFGAEAELLHSVIDFILAQQLPDGGFNCQYNRKGAVHSALNSTLCVLEGILSYYQNGYTYGLPQLLKVKVEAEEFILQHRLYKSDKTGSLIHKSFIMLSYPCRWRYDILRALDYFRAAGVPYDEKMADAIDVLKSKRRKDGTWPVQNKHAGEVHFDMEPTGRPSRWNTLRALRVLKHFNIEY